jgi:hypothetical protein
MPDLLFNPVLDYFHPITMKPRESFLAASWTSPGSYLFLFVAQIVIQTLMFGILMLIPAWALSLAKTHFQDVYSTSQGAAALGGIAVLAACNLFLYSAGLVKALIRTLKEF